MHKSRKVVFGFKSRTKRKEFNQIANLTKVFRDGRFARKGII